MHCDYVARARALVGCRFRAQGRDPALGLDCAGFALAVYAVEDEFRRDYQLRGNHMRALKAALALHFRRISRPQRRAGDLLIWSVAADQLHLGVAAAETFIHAEARLGHVVESPNPPPWPLTAVFRRRIRPALEA